ncbi:MAG: DegT/DnrJ/EryC1/StrS aminotransferase family protein, partial [Syntrophomonadaceae bacterium]|nr:DegT/DnrJ/EryC1/StrS aminotransferase family protein [Syntrophomonadaceae bacterium]
MIEKRKIIQVAEPYFDEREWEAIKEPIKSGWVTQGPKVAEFEQAFAQKHGVKHGIATTSCTT